jgi:predicted alpha/beta-fold hydrolase
LGPAEEPLRIPLDDAGHALLAQVRWAEGRKPAIVLVHGVGGSIESNYVRRAARAIARRGFHAVRFNLRGAGASLELAPTLYHAGLSADLERLAVALASDARVSALGAIGFSLGGNLSLCWAAGPSATSPRLKRAVAAISAPVDLAATSRNLGTLAALPYRWYLMPSLVAQARAFAARHPEAKLFDLAALEHVRTVWEYDDVVVGPMHGFGDAAGYYAAASSGPRLRALQCPALILQAEDDPMVPAASVRPFMEGAPVESVFTRRGGHVGFVADLREASWVENWAVRQALDFLERELSEPRAG